MTTDKIAPPMAARKPVEINQLGRIRTDAYAWLRADNWQDVMSDPSALPGDIKAYLDAENAFTKALLEEPTAELQATLFAEMRGRIKEDASSVPQTDGPWAYATRHRAGGEYPLYYRRPTAGDTDAEHVLFDGDEEAKDSEYFDLGDVEHSPDHMRLAWSVDYKGSEFYTIFVRDIATGAPLTDPIEASAGDFVWSADATVIYWVKRDSNGRASSLWRRVLAANTDTLLYQEADPAFSISLAYSDTGEHILVNIGSHTTTEIHHFPKDSPNIPVLTCVAKRQTDHEYSVSAWQGRWIIRTNCDGAVDFKLMQAEIGSSSQASWRAFIPHTAGTLILGVEAFAGYLVREERENNLPRIVIRDGDGNEHHISMDEAAYDLDVISGYEYHTQTLRFGYASPTTPDQIYDYDMAQKTRVLRKQREIPSGHRPDDYITESLLVSGHDGAEIPVTLLRHKNTPLDGTAPVLLYGYGSYGITIPADFRTGRLSLVDRGFIYVMAHIRGSMAKGYNWYLDGKKAQKPNTFLDFLSVADHLIDAGYTQKGKIVAHGGSAGGLLMGAVANMRPEVFAGIIADVPFVDVLNTMSDGSLPLTPPEWPEWGDPTISQTDYDTIWAYSPYDQLSNQAYPPMLITGGLTDPRVTYWEPAKWCAKLRYMAPDAGPYYMKINMDSGHGGASGRFEGLKDVALNYAFALRCVNSE